ncbi:putative Pyridoxal-5'-phosphate-dependent enzyme, beta family threonine synthase [Cupriavidus phytorum]|uniref:Pyridoxal-5'-phosphate-dependent enzyme, beta family threonine synthase n=2 Tax=Cupriavidus TaxID=106589 RepID=A0A375CJG5_9BURK|nr:MULTISPECIES: pyridoxal-phosphate dependent enzyme [Cupriavidus]PZX34083.1 threonine synthase [Cupriavidus alkaliphilus]SOY72041.1 putative Pyridoxal-5'-phosphate-dependent enzyme, beta family threonine synthase [Cupriavidus taiwanensis]
MRASGNPIQPLINPSMQGLRCITCHARYLLDDMPEGCPACAAAGHPSSLEAVYDTRALDFASKSGSYTWGHWQPYLDGVSLGEGATPCLPVPVLASLADVASVWVKNEGANPTGSHKDRMSAQAVSRALDIGAREVVLASSGNAAVSAAAYCAAAGLDCEVATYQALPAVFDAALRHYGARRVVCDSGHARWAHVRRRVRDGGAFALTNYNVPAVGSPVFGVEGYRAVALEWVAQGCRPDHVIVPTARGDLLWGIYSALRDLVALGHLPKLPRLWAVEPFPRLSRVLAGASQQSDFAGTTIQFSTAGSTVTAQQVLAVRRSGGGAVVVDDAAARDGTRHLAAAGFWVELCAGAGLAAAQSLRADGRIDRTEAVMLMLTARGDRDPGQA